MGIHDRDYYREALKEKSSPQGKRVRYYGMPTANSIANRRGFPPWLIAIIWAVAFALLFALVTYLRKHVIFIGVP